MSLVLDPGEAAAETSLEARFSGALAILQMINSTASFVVAALLFAMVFKVLSAVRLTWRDVWTGAVVTSFLFTVGKFLIGFHLGRTASPRIMARRRRSSRSCSGPATPP